jgi:CRP-like cAMP-binding protein
MSDSTAPLPPTPTVTASLLKNVGLFGGIDDKVLEVLARELAVRTVEVNDLVVTEGDQAREMFVVLSGELEVLKKSRTAVGGEARVALLGPLDWFGEMSIIDVQPRSASVRAVAPSALLLVTAEDVDRMLYRSDLRSYTLLVMNIARELSRRLRVADGILADLVTTVAQEYVERRRR